MKDNPFIEETIRMEYERWLDVKKGIEELLVIKAAFCRPDSNVGGGVGFLLPILDSLSRSPLVESPPAAKDDEACGIHYRPRRTGEPVLPSYIDKSRENLVPERDEACGIGGARAAQHPYRGVTHCPWLAEHDESQGALLEQLSALTRERDALREKAKAIPKDAPGPTIIISDGIDPVKILEVIAPTVIGAGVRGWENVIAAVKELEEKAKRWDKAEKCSNINYVPRLSPYPMGEELLKAEVYRLKEQVAAIIANRDSLIVRVQELEQGEVAALGQSTRLRDLRRQRDGLMRLASEVIGHVRCSVDANSDMAAIWRKQLDAFAKKEASP